MRSVIAWFAAQSLAGGKSTSLAEPAATVRCDSVVQWKGATLFQWDWVLPTDEILAKVERLAEEERKASALKPAPVAIGNGKTVRTDKAHDDLMSRLLKFAWHFKRYS